MTLDPEAPPPAAPPSVEASGTGAGRLAAVRDWLRGRADNSLTRLALLWFRRYLEASRNAGAATSAYFTLSALPTALVIVAFFNLATRQRERVRGAPDQPHEARRDDREPRP